MNEENKELEKTAWRLQQYENVRDIERKEENTQKMTIKRQSILSSTEERGGERAAGRIACGKIWNGMRAMKREREKDRESKFESVSEI